MNRSRKTLCMLLCGVAVAALGFLTSCGGPAQPPKDSSPGKMRAVSLSPGVTEMFFVLGAGDLLVGATDYCNYPPAAKQIERVGGLGKPSLEKLLALSPDLVVTSGAERNDVLQILRKSDIRVLKVKIDSIDEMFEAMRQLGDAVKKRPEADKAVASMQAELRGIASQSAGPRPRVFVELWDDPLTTVGGTSFVDDVIRRAGGVNVAHELPQPYPRISAEKVIEWNPEVVIIAHMARGGGAPSQIGDRIGWSNVAAVKQGRVFCDIPSDLILHPGPRLIDGVKILAKRLHE